MFETLDDVIAYTRNIGAKVPELRSEIVIEPPGLDAKSLGHLTALFPAAPPKFLRVLTSVRLEGVSIGHFQLLGARGHPLIGGLEKMNSAGCPHAAVFQRDRVFQFGALEAEPLCVAFGTSHHGQDRIALYDHERPNVLGRLLAQDLVEFLCVASYVDSIRESFPRKDRSTLGLDKAQECLALQFAGRPQEEAEWHQYARNVLG